MVEGRFQFKLPAYVLMAITKIQNLMVYVWSSSSAALFVFSCLYFAFSHVLEWGSHSGNVQRLTFIGWSRVSEPEFTDIVGVLGVSIKVSQWLVHQT